MKRISKLTSAQESAIPSYIKKWVGYASDPLDEDAARRAVSAMWSSMGQAPPLVMVFDSPLASCSRTSGRPQTVHCMDALSRSFAPADSA